jgi:hypothetical protein
MLYIAYDAYQALTGQELSVEVAGRQPRPRPPGGMSSAPAPPPHRSGHEDIGVPPVRKTPRGRYPRLAALTRLAVAVLLHVCVSAGVSASTPPSRSPGGCCARKALTAGAGTRRQTAAAVARWG